MPTTVTKSIGTAGGRDYSTAQAWQDAMPADLRAGTGDDTVQVGECYNDSEFTGSNTIIFMTGHTTDSTHTITMTTATGQSFRDNAGVQTNALRYNASNGVGFRQTGGYNYVVQLDGEYIFVSNLQIKATPGTAVIALHIHFANCKVDGCLCQGYGANCLQVAQIPVTNCVLIGSGSINPLYCEGGNIVNCTIVAPSDNGTPPNAGITIGYHSSSVENCAVFGCTNADETFSGGSISATTCMTDVASPPTGFTQVTYANQFENTATATLDLRLKSGADCINAGTTATTYIPAAVDVAFTSRPQSTAWDIGAWEFVSAAPPATGAPFFNWLGLSPTSTILAAWGLKGLQAAKKNAQTARRKFLTFRW